MMMWTLLAAMALVTFGFRFAFFAGFVTLTPGPRLQRLLSFSAPCVLTAMATPIAVAPHGELWLTPDSPYLVGGVVAVVLAGLRCSLLWVVVLSLTTFAGLRWLTLMP